MNSRDVITIIVSILMIIIVVGIYEIAKILWRTRFDGELVVDTSHEAKDIYRIELNDEVDRLAKKKTLRLKVVHRKVGNPRAFTDFR